MINDSTHLLFNVTFQIVLQYVQTVPFKFKWVILFLFLPMNIMQKRLHNHKTEAFYASQTKKYYWLKFFNFQSINEDNIFLHLSDCKICDIQFNITQLFYFILVEVISSFLNESNSLLHPSILFQLYYILLLKYQHNNR